jgi:hypothetical protein
MFDSVRRHADSLSAAHFLDGFLVVILRIKISCILTAEGRCPIPIGEVQTWTM